MKTLFAVCTILLCLLCNDQTHRQENGNFPSTCSVAPYTLDVRQSDGSVLSVVAEGNSIIHFTETSDGYTILKGRNGDYYYAERNRDGSIRASGKRAIDPDLRSGRQQRQLNRMEKHIRPEAHIIQQRLQSFENDPVYRDGSTTERFPANGSQKALVILIQYPDLSNEYSTTDFDRLMNEHDYNGSGSFRDFFFKNSFGKLDVQADVFGWYTSSQPYEYYGHQHGYQRSRELMAEAIDAAEAAGVDFSDYDNDGDGIVDAVIGVHAGPGAEMGAQTQYIWSHRWTLGADNQRFYDGVLLSDYIINPETRPWGMVGVGVFCHEFGHVLGLPDLYDLDHSSSGIGNFGLMSKGAWLDHEHHPANLCAWARTLHDWAEPEVIESGAYSLEAADESDRIYRINTADPNEYFLLENKQPVGNDAFLPASGLAIWHIDESRTNLYPGSNTVNMDENHKGVDLEEADGLFQLDTGPFNGDAGDLYPGSTGATRFDAASAPSAHMIDGTATDIEVTNIREVDGIVYFRLNDPVSCSITAVSVGSTLNCGNGTFDQEITVYHDYAPTTGDLIVNGTNHPVGSSPQQIIVEDLPADGSMFDLTLRFSEEPGCNYEELHAFRAPEAFYSYIEGSTCDPNAAGTVIYDLTSSSGCDSVIEVHTVLLPSYEITLLETTCKQDEAGMETIYYETNAGCDSVVHIETLYTEPDPVHVTEMTCRQEEVGIQTLYLSTVEGCDSIVILERIYAEVLQTTIRRTTCKPDEAGVEEFYLTAADGCDSLVVIETTLLEQDEIFLSEVVCQANQAGIETFNLTNSQGCDSIVHMEKVYRDPQPDFSYQSNDRDIEFFMTTSEGEVHEWYLGDGVVSTEQRPVHTFDPGNHEIHLVTYNNACDAYFEHSEWIEVEDVNTAVLTSIEEWQRQVNLYPSPTFGPFTLEWGQIHETDLQLIIRNMNGRQVLETQLQSGQTRYQGDLSDLTPGVYILQLSGEEAVYTQRFVVTN